MNVLAVGCHPDDLEIGCYGTLIKLAKAGHRVIAAHVANGSMGHVQIQPDELGVLRNRESEEAAKLIGVEAITLDVGDIAVRSEDEAQMREMVRVVRYARPDFIITHNPDDYMTDHKQASELVFNASFAASLKHYAPHTGEPVPVSPIFYMDTLAGTGFLPSEYVDISEEIELKLQALACHKSQINWMRDHDGIDFLEFVRACSRGRGCQCGVTYAEAFRPCHHYLRMTTKRLLP